jgi:hypothetical protein
MSKVITFSRKFPAYHPRKGEPTYFVEKITKWRLSCGERPVDINCDFNEEMYYICEPKYHTIRAGHRWKVGDKFSPRVWSGKPYYSPQITIAPDIEIKNIWNFKCDEEGLFYINEKWIDVTSTDIPNNDGLSSDDFLSWFNKPFNGQVICWSDSIHY